MTARLEGPSDAAKMRVMRRDRYTCVYCGAEGKNAELQIDHVVPVAKGGSHHIANLVAACRSCNQSKGVKDAPKMNGAKPMNNSGFDGLFVHAYKNGKIHNQGQIIGKDEGLYALQLFSFMDGRPTNVRFITQDFLVNECKVYSTEDEWIYAHLLEMESMGLLRGTVEENMQMREKMNNG
tara:strand:- start:1022 stop:1561 length:540 start_codon:yes stop_codon:yes gene_type:complete